MPQCVLWEKYIKRILNQSCKSISREERHKNIDLKNKHISMSTGKGEGDIPIEGIAFAKGQRQAWGKACWELKKAHDDWLLSCGWRG